MARVVLPGLAGLTQLPRLLGMQEKEVVRARAVQLGVLGRPLRPQLHGIWAKVVAKPRVARVGPRRQLQQPLLHGIWAKEVARTIVVGLGPLRQLQRRWLLEIQAKVRCGSVFQPRLPLQCAKVMANAIVVQLGLSRKLVIRAKARFGLPCPLWLRLSGMLAKVVVNAIMVRLGPARMVQWWRLLGMQAKEVAKAKMLARGPRRLQLPNGTVVRLGPPRRPLRPRSAGIPKPAGPRLPGALTTGPAATQARWMGDRPALTLPAGTKDGQCRRPPMLAMLPGSLMHGVN